LSAISGYRIGRKVLTLILWGEQDTLIPVSVSDTLLRLIPGSPREIIPECGHLPALEKPTELIRHVDRFLSQTKDPA
jgi:pimeloyl-ACP methyl ester carboxylesterase